jgi:hypothetical protein
MIIILDDCNEWIVSDFSKNEKLQEAPVDFRFTLTKGYPYHTVFLTHFWLFTEDPMKKIELTLPEIMQKNTQFSSMITLSDWVKMSKEKYPKQTFILLPQDYCSDKRFTFNQKFILYEIKRIAIEYPE